MKHLVDWQLVWLQRWNQLLPADVHVAAKQCQCSFPRGGSQQEAAGGLDARYRIFLKLLKGQTLPFLKGEG